MLCVTSCDPRELSRDIPCDCPTMPAPFQWYHMTMTACHVTFYISGCTCMYCDCPFELSRGSLIKSHHLKSKTEHLLFTHVIFLPVTWQLKQTVTCFTPIYKYICKNNPIWTSFIFNMSRDNFASTKKSFWYLIPQLLILIRTWHWKLWQCKYVICGWTLCY